MFGFHRYKAHAETTQGAAEIGDRMEDGTIYAGISPDTGKKMYTTSADAPLTMTWNQCFGSA